MTEYLDLDPSGHQLPPKVPTGIFKSALLSSELDSSPAHESESEFGLTSPSPSLESGRTMRM